MYPGEVALIYKKFFQELLNFSYFPNLALLMQLLCKPSILNLVVIDKSMFVYSQISDRVLVEILLSIDPISIIPVFSDNKVVIYVIRPWIESFLYFSLLPKIIQLSWLSRSS